jgi:hypothetical protein
MANLFNFTHSPAELYGSKTARAETEDVQRTRLESSYDAFNDVAAELQALQDALVDEDSMARTALEQVRRDHPNIGRKELVWNAKRLYQQHKDQKKREIEAAREQLVNLGVGGLGYLPEDMFPSEEQKAEFEAKGKFKLSKLQARNRALAQAKTPEEIVAAAMAQSHIGEGEFVRKLPTTEDPSVFAEIIRKMEAPFRTVGGAVRGAHGELAELTKDVPVQMQDKAPSVMSQAVHQVAKRVPGPWQGAALMPDFVSLAANLPNLVEVVPEGEEPKFQFQQSEPRSMLVDALDPEQTPTFAGLPVRESLQAFSENPGQVINAAADQAHKALVSEDFTEGSIAGTLREGELILKKKALAQARYELDNNAPRQLLVERASQIYKELIEKDAARSFIKNPATSELVLGTAIDPLTYAGPGIAKAIGKPFKAVKDAGKLGAVAHKAASLGGGAATGGFLGGLAGYMADQDDLGMVGGALVGMGLKAGGRRLLASQAHRLRQISHRPELHLLDDEAASLLRLDESRAEHYVRDLYSKAHEDVRAMSRLKDEHIDVLGDIVDNETAMFGKRLSGEEALAVADDLLTSTKTAYRPLEGKIRQNFVDAWEAQKRSRLRHELMRNVEAKGTARAWVGDKLKRHKDRRDYSPWKRNFEEVEGAETSTFRIKGKGKSVKGVTPGSAKERRKKRYTGDLNIAQRWANEWAEAIPKAGRAKEIQDVGKRLRKAGYVWKVRAPKGTKFKQKHWDRMQEEVKRLEAETGMEWVILNKGKPVGRGQLSLSDVYEQIHGPDKGIKGNVLVAVPKAIEMRLRELAPFINDGTEALTAFEQFNNAYLKRVNKTWQAGVTVWNPAFTPRNVISGFGLSVLAMGARALNPKLQLAAIEASILGAAAKNPAALKQLAKRKWRMRRGQVTTMDRLWREFEKTGLGSQLEARFAAEGLSTVAGKGEDLLAKGLRKGQQAFDAATDFGNAKGLRYASPGFSARASENYQRFITWLGALDDLSEAGIARATDFSSKWSANYMRLGAFEKNVLRDVFSFYGWARFAAPLLFKGIAAHPDRIMNFLRLRRSMEEAWAPEGAPGWAAQPKYLRTSGVIAPPSMQPKYKKGENYPGVGTHDFAMLAWEDPIGVTVNTLRQYLGFLPHFQKVGQRIRPGENLNPGYKQVVEFLTLRDIRTGDDLSHLDRTAQLNPVERPSDTFMNMIRLYLDHGQVDQAANMWLRYFVSRQLPGYDTAMQTFGSAANMITELFTGKPGTFKAEPGVFGVPNTTFGVSPHLVRGIGAMDSQRREVTKPAKSSFYQEKKDD